MKYIPVKVASMVGRKVLEAKMGSPKVLFGLGILGSVTSTVLACRATLQLDNKLTELEKNVQDVKSVVTTDETSANRQLARVYATATFDIAKLYGPSFVLGAVSIAALTTSHVTMTRRNAGLTAAYTAVAASYEAYRDRVREAYGEEIEKDLYHAIKLEEVVVGDKKVMERVADPNKWSPYARFFDEASPCWVPQPEYNRLFVQAQQTWLNNLLHARGHVFLNEAYDALGIERSQAGQVVGWVVNQGGDNFIDFGIFEARDEAKRAFVNGYERSILLDFNVDGPIQHLI